MQDKEFDQLFKDKFDDAQIEPSANLWANIEAELAPKRKRAFPVYWMAAAVVLITLTAALLVFNKEDKVQLQGRTADVVKPSAIADGEVGDTLVDQVKPIAQDNTPAEEGILVATSPAKSSLVAEDKKAVQTPDQNSVKNNLAVMQPNQVIAHLTTKEPIVKESPVELPKAKVDPAEVIVIASADVPVVTGDEVINENDMADKRGIRNMGDLINFVVDKVDKREDKLIRFDTDDDNSSLIGINIGMIRFSKKKHK